MTNTRHTYICVAWRSSVRSFVRSRACVCVRAYIHMPLACRLESSTVDLTKGTGLMAKAKRLGESTFKEPPGAHAARRKTHWYERGAAGACVARRQVGRQAGRPRYSNLPFRQDLMASRHGKCPPRVILRRSLAAVVTASLSLFSNNPWTSNTCAPRSRSARTLNERVHGIKAGNDISATKRRDVLRSWMPVAWMWNKLDLHRTTNLVYLNI